MSGPHAHHDFQKDNVDAKCIDGVDSSGDPFFDDEVLVGVRRRALKLPEIDEENAFYFGPKRRRIDRGSDDDCGQRWDADHLDMYAGMKNNPYALNFENGEVVSRVVERPEKHKHFRISKGVGGSFLVLVCIGVTLVALYFSGMFDSATVPDIDIPGNIVGLGLQYAPSAMPSHSPSYTDRDIGMILVVSQDFTRITNDATNILDPTNVTAFENVIENWLDADSLGLSDPSTIVSCEVLYQNVASDEISDSRRMNDVTLITLTVSYSVSWASRFEIEVDIKKRVEAYVANSASIDALYELMLQAGIFVVEEGVGPGIVIESLPSTSPIHIDLPSGVPSQSLEPTNMVTFNGEGNSVDVLGLFMSRCSKSERVHDLYSLMNIFPVFLSYEMSRAIQ